ncbi:Flp family type IVb pilin [Vibrio breoganii]
MKGFTRFLSSEQGLTVVEYVLGAALLVGTISLVFVALEGELTTSLQTTFDYAHKDQ